jgi:hypothetical protein
MFVWLPLVRSAQATTNARNKLVERKCAARVYQLPDDRFDDERAGGDDLQIGVKETELLLHELVDRLALQRTGRLTHVKRSASHVQRDGSAGDRERLRNVNEHRRRCTARTVDRRRRLVFDDASDAVRRLKRCTLISDADATERRRHGSEASGRRRFVSST